MQWLRGITRWVLVTVGIILLTSFTIDATDALRGSNSALSILSQTLTVDECPTGTVEVALADRTLCVDQYEASPSADCPHQDPRSPLETRSNVNALDCESVSQPDVLPWRYVTYHQAKTMCVRSGKRLLTNHEWYEAALGTRETDCNITGRLAQTGADECVSSYGAYNMIGNLWEWVDAEVTEGEYAGRLIPAAGYVIEADSAGVALQTASSPEPLYESDYFWSSASGTYGMIRGGFYGSGEDGGLYSTHADVALSFTSPGTGFRCVTQL